jgi:hypothetical protein
MARHWMFILLAGVAAGQNLRDLTPRYLLLDTMRESTLRRELEHASAIGYRVVAGVASTSLVLEKVASPPETYRYQFAHNEQEANAAGQNGFRLRPLVKGRRGDKQEQYWQVFLMEKAPGNKERWTYSLKRSWAGSCMVRYTMGEAYFYGHERNCLTIFESPDPASPEPFDSDLVTVRFLTAETAAKLVEAVRDATAAGYRIIAGCDGEMALVLEKVRGSREKYPSILVAAKLAATLEEKLNQGARDGYRLVPAAIGVYRKYLFGVFEGLQTETYAVMERARADKNRYEYRLVTGQAGLNAAADDGFTVVAMEDLTLRGSVVFLEKALSADDK